MAYSSPASCCTVTHLGEQDYLGRVLLHMHVRHWGRCVSEAYLLTGFCENLQDTESLWIARLSHFDRLLLPTLNRHPPGTAIQLQEAQLLSKSQY